MTMMMPPQSFPHLRCVNCGDATTLGPHFFGCPNCRTGDQGWPLEVVYDYAGFEASDILKRWGAHDGSLWRFRDLLPLPQNVSPITLQEGGTPLVALDVSGPGRLWVKDETRNPTGAFKDRFHTVSLSMARALGYAKVTASTTGNHGTSMAAYAAKGQLRSLVFCDPRAPEVQRRVMQLFGAHVGVLGERGDHLQWLVRERGWYPSTYMSPMPVATPYGVEGYKTIGYEVYFQLGRRFPAYMLVPVAMGDVLYGPWKGFRELQHLGAEGALPRMVAVQAAGCDPIVQGFRHRANEVPVHSSPDTIAVSIADPTAGPASLKALYDSDGLAISVTDAAIIEAMRVLARSGIVVEPSSAASVAGALLMRQRAEINVHDDVVCLLTGSGVKWPDHLLHAIDAHELQDQDPTTVRAWIESFDTEAPGQRDMPPARMFTEGTNGGLS
jgi:threonine synthase